MHSPTMPLKMSVVGKYCFINTRERIFEGSLLAEMCKPSRIPCWGPQTTSTRKLQMEMVQHGQLCPAHRLRPILLQRSLAPEVEPPATCSAHPRLPLTTWLVAYLSLQRSWAICQHSLVGVGLPDGRVLLGLVPLTQSSG